MIKTGKTPISLMTYCAIMSISLIVNLPGLAVSPMLGRLHEVFPATTQIEDQLLTVLPNLLIIPFIILSGKLSQIKNKSLIITGALILFAASAVGYMFSSSMTQLIIISCLIGCGAGVLVPYSTGLIADAFSGSFRLKEMGIQSGIANTAVMLATFAVGWLCHGNWHLPFVVYLIAFIPLLLVYWLRYIPRQDYGAPQSPEEVCGDKCGANGPDKKDLSRAVAVPSLPDQSLPKTVDGFYVGRLLSVVAAYFFLTFATISISYYCPFLIEKQHWDESLAGSVTAIYFLFIFIPGYLLPWFVKILRGHLFFTTAVIVTVGIALFAFLPSPATMCVGAALAGLGYGICQPVFYDKASQTVNNPNKSTMALSYVLAANYVAIVLAPFIIDFFRALFEGARVKTFAFVVCFALLIPYIVLTLLYRKSFVFSISSGK